MYLCVLSLQCLFHTNLAMSPLEISGVGSYCRDEWIQALVCQCAGRRDWVQTPASGPRYQQHPCSHPRRRVVRGRRGLLTRPAPETGDTLLHQTTEVGQNCTDIVIIHFIRNHSYPEIIMYIIKKTTPK